MFGENNMNHQFNNGDLGVISYYQQNLHEFSFPSVEVVNSVPKIVHTIYELPRVVPELPNKLSYFNEITPSDRNIDQSFNKFSLPGVDSFCRMSHLNTKQNSPQSDSSLSDTLQSIHQSISDLSNELNFLDYLDQLAFTNQASSLSVNESQYYEFQIADESQPELSPVATPTTNLLVQSATLPQSSCNLHDRGATVVENVPLMTIQAESSVSNSQSLSCNGSIDQEKLKSFVYDIHNEVEYFARPMCPLVSRDEEPTKIVDDDPMMNLDSFIQVPEDPSSRDQLLSSLAVVYFGDELPEISDAHRTEEKFEAKQQQVAFDTTISMQQPSAAMSPVVHENPGYNLFSESSSAYESIFSLNSPTQSNLMLPRSHSSVESPESTGPACVETTIFPGSVYDQTDSIQPNPLYQHDYIQQANPMLNSLLKDLPCLSFKAFRESISQNSMLYKALTQCH